MKTQGVFTVIKNKDEHILLVKRRDFPLWDLPGGRVENGETLSEAAERETLEETGFKIMIEALRGSYYNPELDDTQFVFIGKIISGSPIRSGSETAAVKFFPESHLPLLMIPHRKMQIKKALTKSSAPIIQEIHDSWFIRKIKTR